MKAWLCVFVLRLCGYQQFPVLMDGPLPTQARVTGWAEQPLPSLSLISLYPWEKPHM